MVKLIMFSSTILIPIIMIVAGLLMWKRCPKKINQFYGYRTKMSMLNEDTWQFAHSHCGRLMFRLGIVVLFLTVVAHFPFINSSEKVFGDVSLVITMVDMVILLMSTIPTHIALKKKFNKDGSRK